MSDQEQPEISEEALEAYVPEEEGESDGED